MSTNPLRYPRADAILLMLSLVAAGCQPSAVADGTGEGPAASGTPVVGEWPGYRGPLRDGIAPDQDLLREWPSGGPEVLWKVPLGEGYSGLSVSGGRLFTLFSRDGDERAAAFDAATGKELWSVRLDSAYKNQFGNGPRSTPTVDGDLVYVLGAQGQLHALKVSSGESVWHHDLVREYGARIPTWGIATSPLVEGDLLLVDVGGRDGYSLVAFRKGSGEVAWKAADNPLDGAGYSAPIAFEVGGVRQVLFLIASKLVAVAPAEGTILWSFPWSTEYNVNAATPIFVPPNRVFVSTGYGTGASLLQVERTDQGGFRAQELWHNPSMRNQFSSSVRLGDFLYGFDNRTLKCLRVDTGEEMWKERGLGHGSLLAADGLLFVLGERGELVLVEASPEAFQEKARVQLLHTKTWTVPTLVDGRLFVRDEEQLVSLRVSPTTQAPAPATS